jgi:hypothetical protein
LALHGVVAAFPGLGANAIAPCGGAMTQPPKFAHAIATSPFSFARYDRKIKNPTTKRIWPSEGTNAIAGQGWFAFARKKATFKRVMAAPDRLSPAVRLPLPNKEFPPEGREHFP